MGWQVSATAPTSQLPFLVLFLPACLFKIMFEFISLLLQTESPEDEIYPGLGFSKHLYFSAVCVSLPHSHSLEVNHSLWAFILLSSGFEFSLENRPSICFVFLLAFRILPLCLLFSMPSVFP